MIEVMLNNEMEFDVPVDLLSTVVKKVVADHGYSTAEISLAVIDDPTMHELNRRHLQHDYPTDVLSFVLDDDGPFLEGEVVVSADTASAKAPEYDWPYQSELLLYFIHGTLHLVGYDDHTPEDRQEMRRKEVHYLRSIQIEPPANHASRVHTDRETSA